MNENSPDTFPSFQEIGVVVYLITALTLLFYQLPAYKMFRSRALLLLVIASALDLAIILFDETVGRHGLPNPENWWTAMYVREIIWLIMVILATAGSVMFIRDYQRLAKRLQEAEIFVNASAATGSGEESKTRHEAV